MTRLCGRRDEDISLTSVLMTWVKICGMTNLEDALTAVDAGADAVGFVFYKESPRNISVEAARKIVEKLPESVEKVGVFVNEPPERVSAIADEVGLSAVQFHGDEHQNPKMYATDRRVLLCIPASWVALTLRKKGKAFGSLMALPKNLEAIMLDSGGGTQRGGTGHPFDWQETRAWVSLMSKDTPVVIAGGLTPGNVGEAIGILQPWGVDVASGVEVRPGKKDPEKVRAFVKAVRESEKRNGCGG
jgi:phosphoribosylanthranilate isomerase